MSQFPPPPGPGGPASPPPGGGASAPGPGPGPGQPMQGYPQQPQQKKSNAALWIILLVVLVGGGVAAFVLMGGDDGGGSNASPDGAVTGFVNAAIDQDCEAASNYVTEEFATSVGGCDATEDSGFNSLDEVTVVSEDEQTATVDATITTDDGSTTTTFNVVNVDGEWKVDGLGGTAPGAGGGEGGEGGGEGGGEASEDDGGEGGSSSGSSGSPEEVAVAFAEAFIAGDCDLAAQYAEVSSPAANACEPGENDGITITSSEVTSETDDSAEVVIESTRGPGSVSLVLVDGEWKVYNVS